MSWQGWRKRFRRRGLEEGRDYVDVNPLAQINWGTVRLRRVTELTTGTRFGQVGGASVGNGLGRFTPWTLQDWPRGATSQQLGLRLRKEATG